MISETPLQPTVDIDMISLMRDDEMADRPLEKSLDWWAVSGDTTDTQHSYSFYKV